MGYPNRRYRVVDGKLEKVWNGTNDPGWFVAKADAWAAEEARLIKAAAKPTPFGEWKPGLPPPPPPATAQTETADYETWKGPKLRSEIKARTGKGPKVGAESTKVAMIERLRALDYEPMEPEPEEPKPDGKPVVIPPGETEGVVEPVEETVAEAEAVQEEVG